MDLPASANVGSGSDGIIIDGWGPSITLDQPVSTLLSDINGRLGANGDGTRVSVNSSNQLVVTPNSADPGAPLTLSFQGNGAADLGLTGGTYAASNGGGLGIAAASFGTAGDINAALTTISTALTTVRAQASTLGQSLGTVQTYQSFNQNLINDLNAGSNDLTAADTNQESAALLTLQTQQQLGISALSLASQAQQAVLKLFP